MEQEYIYIFEDGTIKVGVSPTEDDLAGCDDGVLNIINPSTLQEYYQGEWVELKKI